MPLSKVPSQNLFSLDPVKTTLTAPTTNVQVQGPENRSRADAQFSRGLQGFATSLGNLGDLAKTRQRTADIKLAEEAAIRGDLRPDSVFKDADDAFDNINDANTSWEVLRNIKEWEEGEQGHNLINSQGALSTNHTATHNVYDGFESTGVDQIANPILKAKLSEQIRARRDEVKKLQFGIDQERKQNVASIAVRNEVEELIAGTGSDNPLDEIDLKGSIRSMALEYAGLDIGVEKDEAALIVAQMFLLNEDVKTDPEFGINILEAEFSKDVPFQALLSKGLNPLNDDPYGTAFAKMYSAFLTAADKEQRDAIAQEKADNITNKDEALKSVYAQYDDFKSSRGMATALVATGFYEELEANKIAKARKTFIETEVMFQEGDQPHLDAVELILSQHPLFQRESDIDQLITDGFMNPKVKAGLMTHLGEEGKQKERHIKAFKDSVSTVIGNTLALSKITLKNKNALADLIAAPDKELSQVDFQSRIFALLRPGLTNPDELRIVVDRLQDLRNDINKEAYKRGVISSKLDRENGEVDPLTLEQFQTGYVQPSVRALVDAIDAGLPETRIVQAPVEVPMTAADYPLIVNQDKDIFSKDQPGGVSNISPSSSATGAVTFSSKDSATFSSVISEDYSSGFPFKATQNEVIDLKALVRDTTLYNFSTDLATMVEDLALKEVERNNKLEEDKKALTPEGQRKSKREETRAKSKQFASDFQENLSLIPGFVLDLVTPTPETIKAIKEALDPENISSILPDGPTPEERQKSLEVKAEKQKAVQQFNENFKDFFSIKGLVDLVGEIVSPGDAESASTSQDADFDPTTEGPRGIDKEGTRNELAKDLGLPPDFSEARFEGGTSEESDIEGFTGEDIDEDTGEEVDMPPVVMDEIVVSETKPNRAQQRLEAFNQAFPDVPNERNTLRGLQDTAKFKEDVPTPKVLQKEITTALKTIPVDSKNPQQIAQASMSIMPVLKLLAPVQTNVLTGYLTKDAPAHHMIAYGGRGAFYSAQNALGLLSPERKQNLTRLESFVKKNAKAAFSQELKKIKKHIGLGVDDLKEHMKLIYMSETNVGTNVEDSIPTRAGDRPAIGDLQVMATTFRDLIGKQFGKAAAGIAGLDYTELKTLKDNNDVDALQALLRNRNVNFVASMAKMIQYLEVKANQTPTYKAAKIAAKLAAKNAAKLAAKNAAAKIKKTTKKITGK